jgi:hypothetical protein
LVHRGSIRAVALTGLIFLLAPGVASGAVRYAAPAGTGTACTQISPCEIHTAVGDPAVVDGDEVVLAPGTYITGTSPVVAGKAIDVHGTPGAPRPLINANSGFVAYVVGAFGSLEDVEVLNSAPGISVILIRGASAKRIIAMTSAANGSGCHLQPDAATPSVLQNSACIATAPGGAGVSSSLGVSAGVNAVSRMRNVTAVGTGPSSTGVKVSSSGNGGAVTVDALNVIASGTSSDLSAIGGTGGSAAIADFSFSDFDTQFESTNGIVSDPGSDSNVTAPALLVNPAVGDVHQRPGSWTIDRGSRDLAGDSLDIDAESRSQGAAPDIGADELTVLRRGRKCFGESATILAPASGQVIGTEGHDVIVGTPGRDVILSNGGRDLICSLGGRDRVRAGGGPDKVKAAGAGDKLFGQGGNDRLLGGGGRDRIKGGAGKDLLVGQSGADRLAGGGGRDRCGSGSAKDRIVGCE